METCNLNFTDTPTYDSVKDGSDNYLEAFSDESINNSSEYKFSPRGLSINTTMR